MLAGNLGLYRICEHFLLGQGGNERGVAGSKWAYLHPYPLLLRRDETPLGSPLFDVIAKYGAKRSGAAPVPRNRLQMEVEFNDRIGRFWGTDLLGRLLNSVEIPIVHSELSRILGLAVIFWYGSPDPEY